jgi:TBC1 domain family member 2
VPVKHGLTRKLDAGERVAEHRPIMSSRGLPGFLRRSLRPVEYDDDDGETVDRSSSGVNEVMVGSTQGDNDAVKEDTSAAGSSVFVAVQPAPLLGQPEGEAKHKSSDDRERLECIIDGGESDRTKGSDFLPENSKSDRHDQLPSRLSDSSWHEIAPPLPQEPLSEKKSYREAQFEKVLGADVVNMTELRKLAWNGIPFPYRAQIWKLLLGYLPTNASRRDQTMQRKRAEYRDAMAQHYNIDDDSRTLQEQETLRQVLVDVPRTQPDIPLFRNDRIKRVLSRLLYIWAMRHPASSYVQGINDLATPLVAVFLADYFEGTPPDVVLEGHVMNHLPDDRLDEVEADVYWCLTNLLAGIQDHYTADQPGVQRMVARLEELVHRIDSDLTRHICDDTGIQFLQFSFKWMNCLLLREFHLRCVFRLWDTYLSEKDGFEDFHVYVCAAFMCQFSSQLQEMTFDELFGFMQDIPTGDWTDTEVEVLLSQAYVLSTLFKGSDAHLTSNNGLT